MPASSWWSQAAGLVGVVALTRIVVLLRPAAPYEGVIPACRCCRTRRGMTAPGMATASRTGIAAAHTTGVESTIHMSSLHTSSLHTEDRTRSIPNRLDAFRYGNMMAAMARAATTSDVFNAIAEPQRREILVLLRAGERPVTELAQELGMSQPGASKHLRVLREVGLVRDRKAGKQRLYGLDARGLRPVHEWAGGFEQFWNESFDRLDAYVQDLKQARQGE